MIKKLLTIATTVYVVSGFSQATLTITPSTTYQTITGWGEEGGTNTQYEGTPPYLVKQIINESVNVLGLNRLRYECFQGNAAQSYGMCPSWEMQNDNASPDTLSMNALDTIGVDYYMKNYFVPYKQAVQAKGETFSFYVSPSWYFNGSTGDIPAFLRYSPGEYSEYLLSNMNYIKNKYALVPDYVNICNEAGNNNVFTPALVANMIPTVAQWINKAGYTNTGIQFPECVSPQITWNYIQALTSNTTIWPYIKKISYHLYGTSDPYRANIKAFAQSKGIPTAQTEQAGQGIVDMYQDLTLGGVSDWDFYGNGDFMPLNSNSTWFSYGAKYWTIGQVVKHVSLGSTRIGITSSDTTITALSFNNGGQITTVILNMNAASTTQTITLSGIPQGIYGIDQSTGSGTPSSRGVITVPVSGTTTVSLTAQTVISIYPHTTNLSPYATSFKANPTYLDLPTSGVSLSAAGIDPEMSTVTYHWVVDSFPVGATVNISNANISNPSVTGMTVAGDYVFAVAMSDGSAVTTKTITVQVFSGNQAPIISSMQSRIPVIVILPVDTTILHSYAYDIEGTAVTYSYSIVSQPAGASATLAAPTSQICAARNMAIAGNYVFKLTVSDGTLSTSRNMTVPVYPLNHRPVINSITALPATTNLSADSALLTATTSDPDGDIVTRWWTVSSAPVGANPTFTWQGERITEVKNLTVAGTYIFKLYAIDRTLYDSSTVTVIVSNTTGIENNLGNSQLSIYPNPTTSSLQVISSNLQLTQLQITDILGKDIMQVAMKQGKATIDVRNLVSGIYFIKTTQGTQKFIKQ